METRLTAEPPRLPNLKCTSAGCEMPGQLTLFAMYLRGANRDNEFGVKRELRCLVGPTTGPGCVNQAWYLDRGFQETLRLADSGHSASPVYTNSAREVENVV